MLSRVKNKKGISEVVGYILLIGISIAMSIIVYAWLKTYVPAEAPTCADGTSFYISDINCTGGKLNISFENNGKFSINGYYIHASDNPDTTQLATIDLSSKIINGGFLAGNSILFSQITDNSLNPGDEMQSSFDVSGYNTLYKIEIIPTRIQESNNQKLIVSCANAKVDENFECSSS